MVDIVDISESVVYATPTLEEVREHLIYPTETHNGMISRLLVAACEKAEQVTWRSLTAHQFQMEFMGHDGTISLLRSPIASVDEVKYYNGDSWEVIDAADYDVFGISEKTIELSILYQRVQVKYTTSAYANRTVQKLIMDLVQVWYDNKPDADDAEQLIVNRLAKFKVWQVE